MPFSPTSGIGHCWRQDLWLCQPLVLTFFLSFWSPFCLQHTTDYPSGTVMTQLQMLLYSHQHYHHQIAANVWNLLLSLSLSRAVHSPNQGGVWLTLGTAVINFCRIWFKIKYLPKNFAEKGKNSANISILWWMQLICLCLSAVRNHTTKQSEIRMEASNSFPIVLVHPLSVPYFRLRFFWFYLASADRLLYKQHHMYFLIFIFCRQVQAKNMAHFL